ncbi:tetraacyldisaccharide 4'-kinase [Pseudoalteromonas fenneropenaei]|uniref:Tetraacyldisaccharide 4'-kinase n=1 Tax=Pseudoalteromonas fenneropenaei TaxID=1737459 RepID=A0ABV7CHM6_9GAMM
MSQLEASWYGKKRWFTYLLLPLSGLFYLIATLRRGVYQLGIMKPATKTLPVIVIGNISVGGNGKTPFALWLAEYLSQQGKKVAIVSRGYGSKAPYYPYSVTEAHPAEVVGDEPKLLQSRLGCPLVISPDRNAALALISRDFDVDVVLSDDGLQHYAMARDVELCIVDSQRQFGNRLLMPAGPLREPVSRTKSVDLVIENGGHAPLSYQLQQDGFYRVLDNTLVTDINKAHAVSAIGNPQRFIDSLAAVGVEVLSQQHFRDHHQFCFDDFVSCGADAVVMTEKDAVKCRAFAKANWYYLRVSAQPSDELRTALNNILINKGILHGI